MKIKSYIKTILILLFVVSIFVSPLKTVYAETLEEQLERLQQEIESLKQERQNLQSQIDTNNATLSGFNAQLASLYAEMELYNKEIASLELEIQQSELKIEATDKEIKEKLEEIEQSENSIAELEKESGIRIVNSYMNFRMYGSTDGASSIVSIENVNEFFKDSSYKEIIQADTNELLSKIARLRIELLEKKKSLESVQVENQKSRELLAVRQADLNKKRDEAKIRESQYLAQVYAIQSENNQSVSMLNGYTDEQAKKTGEMELVRQQLLNNFVPVNPGEYVFAGKYIGRQGATGFVTGAHLHFEVRMNNASQNPCGYLPPGIAGCGVDGGSLKWPLDPAVWFTSGYGYRCFPLNGSTYCDFHYGIDIIGSSWNAPIFAAHDGFLYKGVDQYGALYIIICGNVNCSTGLKTAYWHLSEY